MATSVPCELDVLFGRERSCLENGGNLLLIQLAKEYLVEFMAADTKSDYLDTGKRDKMTIKMEIVSRIKASGGRFLKRKKNSNEWCEITDRLAAEKVKEAIRRVEKRATRANESGIAPKKPKGGPVVERQQQRKNLNRKEVPTPARQQEKALPPSDFSTTGRSTLNFTRVLEVLNVSLSESDRKKLIDKFGGDSLDGIREFFVSYLEGNDERQLFSPWNIALGDGRRLRDFRVWFEQVYAPAAEHSKPEFNAATWMSFVEGLHQSQPPIDSGTSEQQGAEEKGSALVGPEHELHDVDYPLGLKANHPGKETARQWVVESLEEYMEADQKSARAMLDGRRLRSKRQIITDILQRLGDVGGAVKRQEVGVGGRWTIVSPREARRRIALDFINAKQKQREVRVLIGREDNATKPKRISTADRLSVSLSAIRRSGSSAQVSLGTSPSGNKDKSCQSFTAHLVDTNVDNHISADNLPEVTRFVAADSGSSCDDGPLNEIAPLFRPPSVVDNPRDNLNSKKKQKEKPTTTETTTTDGDTPREGKLDDFDNPLSLGSKNHPGKHATRPWIHQSLDEFRQAEQVSRRAMHDGRVLRSRLSDSSVGAVKQEEVRGRWSVASERYARKSVAGVFLDEIEKQEQRRQDCFASSASVAPGNAPRSVRTVEDKPCTSGPGVNLSFTMIFNAMNIDATDEGPRSLINSFGDDVLGIEEFMAYFKANPDDILKEHGFVKTVQQKRLRGFSVWFEAVYTRKINRVTHLDRRAWITFFTAWIADGCPAAENLPEGTLVVATQALSRQGNHVELSSDGREPVTATRFQDADLTPPAVNVPLLTYSFKDVLFGRGKEYRENGGNLLLTKMIIERYEEYQRAPLRPREGTKDKTTIKNEIVAAVEDSGGRFLQRHDQEQGGVWYEVSEAMKTDKVLATFSELKSKLVPSSQRSKTGQNQRASESLGKDEKRKFYGQVDCGFAQIELNMQQSQPGEEHHQEAVQRVARKKLPSASSNGKPTQQDKQKKASVHPPRLHDNDESHDDVAEDDSSVDSNRTAALDPDVFWKSRMDDVDEDEGPFRLRSAANVLQSMRKGLPSQDADRSVADDTTMAGSFSVTSSMVDGTLSSVDVTRSSASQMMGASTVGSFSIKSGSKGATIDEGDDDTKHRRCKRETRNKDLVASITEIRTVPAEVVKEIELKFKRLNDLIGNASIVEETMNTLADLTLTIENYSIMGLAGDFEQSGIQLLTKAMRLHSLNATIQRHGCLILGNLALSADHREAIANHGGIHLSVQAMTNFPSNEVLQNYGSHALGQLARNNDHRVAIGRQGGIEVVMKAMRTFANHERLQRNGCCVLLELAKDDNNGVTIGRSGGIELVRKAMTKFANNEKLQVYGFVALWELARVDENRVAIGRRGGIELVRKAMTKFANSEQLQRYGCLALSNLAWNNDENRIAIRRQGGIELVRHAMRKFGSNEQLQRYGRLALSNLACVGWD